VVICILIDTHYVSTMQAGVKEPIAIRARQFKDMAECVLGGSSCKKVVPTTLAVRMEQSECSPSQ